jgi:hypothetical protein
MLVSDRYFGGGSWEGYKPEAKGEETKTPFRAMTMLELEAVCGRDPRPPSEVAGDLEEGRATPMRGSRWLCEAHLS